MPRSDHYSPEIDRFLVSCLYHEARERRMPMTRLVDELLRQSLDGSVGLRKAEEAAEAKKQGRNAPVAQGNRCGG
jgi:hypothetical protein